MISLKPEIFILQSIWRKFLIVPAVLLFVIGCSDDKGELPSGSEKLITISPLLEKEMTRITDNSFDENESIGLYVVPYSEDNSTPGNIATDSNAENAEHIYRGGLWTLPSGGKLPWPSPTRHVDLYAYYPYDPSLDNQNPTNYPFAVRTDQRTKAAYDASDFLWAKAENVVPTPDPVELLFSHKLSKVIVNVVSDIDIPDEDINSTVITLLNTPTEGIIDLSDASVSLSGNSESNIITYKHATPSSGYQITGECIIIPQTVPQGQPFIRIEFASNGTRYHYTPTNDIPFLQGTERAINIRITRLGLSVTVSEISDWQPSDIIEGEIGTPLPRVADIDNINWEQSRIHHIYHNGVWIADACREYLRSGNIDAQAIVIYRMNAEGNIDSSQGYVAQVMTYNATTLTYIPSPSNIHGGTVTWAANNQIDSYAPSNNPVIRRLWFTDTGSILPAPDTYINTSTTAPYRLSDIDGNQYGIVKIGNQFWTMENLKVTRYSNGNPIPYYSYNDDPSNSTNYGYLYTWDDMMRADGIAPQGWKLFSYNEFYSMYEYINPVSGTKLKSTSSLWSNPTNNNNITGFSALPGGARLANGTYTNIGTYSYIWTTTRGGGNPTHFRFIYNNVSINTSTDYNTSHALSVRLLRE